MNGRVYQAISSVAAALALDGVAKTRLNARDNYLYRSIDDVLGRLAPLLAKHRLCILPRVLDREASLRHDESGKALIAVTLKVAFDLVSAKDGSCHTIEAFGEALDPGDKATAKAMQSAYKYAVLQAFCVPALPGEDADARSYRPQASLAFGEPANGWQHWCDTFGGAIRTCSTVAELKALQDTSRRELAALSREQSDLYRLIGTAIAGRRLELGGSSGPNGLMQSSPEQSPRSKASAASMSALPDERPPRKPIRVRQGPSMDATVGSTSRSKPKANGSEAHV